MLWTNLVKRKKELGVKPAQNLRIAFVATGTVFSFESVTFHHECIACLQCTGHNGLFLKLKAVDRIKQQIKAKSPGNGEMG